MDVLPPDSSKQWAPCCLRTLSSLTPRCPQTFPVQVLGCPTVEVMRKVSCQGVRCASKHLSPHHAPATWSCLLGTLRIFDDCLTRFQEFSCKWWQSGTCSMHTGFRWETHLDDMLVSSLKHSPSLPRRFFIVTGSRGSTDKLDHWRSEAGKL